MYTFLFLYTGENNKKYNIYILIIYNKELEKVYIFLHHKKMAYLRALHLLILKYNFTLV